jgi:predicted hydrocarbon binding protein
VSFDLPGSDLVAVPRDAVQSLRRVLFRDTGGNAAGYLHEAGYAGGAALHEAFGRWCRTRKLSMPEGMNAPDFARHASAFLSELGWGGVQLTAHDAVLMLDSANWGEADPGSAMQYPGCYFTTGLLSDFFSRIAEVPVAVMEVECRSMTSGSRCRFLVGSAETLQSVYEAWSRGESYERVVGAQV